MWNGGGQPYNHSIFVVVSSTDVTSRFEANASQIIKTITTTAVREIKDPIEDTVFHVVYASG